MPFETKIKKFCIAAGNDGVVMMCMIFLVAGAFAGVAKQMGGVASVVNLGLSFIPTSFVLFNTLFLAVKKIHPVNFTKSQSCVI